MINPPPPKPKQTVRLPSLSSLLNGQTLPPPRPQSHPHHQYNSYQNSPPHTLSKAATTPAFYNHQQLQSVPPRNRSPYLPHASTTVPDAPPPLQPIKQPSPPLLTKWTPLPQNSAERISKQESRLMTAASRAAAVKATSAAVAIMAKRYRRPNKRPNAALHHGALVETSTDNRQPAAKRGRVDDNKSSKTPKRAAPVGPMTCSNCGTTKTPLWRRDPRGQSICNACGLYLKSYGKMRPLSLKRAQKHASGMETAASAGQPMPTSSIVKGGKGTCPGDGTCNGQGGGPSCDGCPAYNQKHLPHITRYAGGSSCRRLTAAERAAAIANGAATDEQGNIVGPLPDGAVGPGRVPPDVAAAIAAAAAEANANTAKRRLEQSPSTTTITPSPQIAPLSAANSTDSAASAPAICFNCNTDYTPLWRRDADGNTTCNACGLYYKLHGKHRPISMKRNTIKRRRRGGGQQTTPQLSVNSEEEGGEEEEGEDVAQPTNGGLQSLMEAATMSPPVQPDTAANSEEVDRRRQELQRQRERLQELLKETNTELDSLDNTQ